MKTFLLLLLSLPLFSLSKENSDFILQQKNGYSCILHSAQKGETLQGIALNYSVKLNVLSNVNNIVSTSELKLGQPIIIPLLETNFFKTSGITNQRKGFHEVYYYSLNDDDVQLICSKFLLQPQTFAKWNQIREDEKIQSGQKFIIGWIKLNELNQTVQLKNTNAQPVVKQVPIQSKQVSSATSKTSSLKSVSSSKSDVSNSRTSAISKDKNISSKSIQNFETKSDNVRSNKPKEGEANEPRLTHFFKKIKNEIKPRKASQESKVENNARITTTNAGPKEESQTVTREVAKNELKENPKQKKSIKEIWSRLVNGKEKPSSKPIEKPLTNEVSNKNKTNVQVVKKEANSKPEAKVVNTSSKSSQTKTAPFKVTKANTNQIIASKPPKENKIKDNSKAAELVKAKQEDKNKTKSNIDNISKSELPPTEIIKDQTIRSEVKQLALLNSKLGKCAYFFSGPGSGQFYAFTNLASKGSIIKVMNTSNNKYIMVEVIGGLPNADIAKGLILKLSDNAKLPLGQKNSVFNIKVNY